MFRNKSDSLENQSVIKKSELHNNSKSVKESLKKKYGLSLIIGNSKSVQELKDKIIKISSYDVNVLISGESGTGKELVARAIHYLSPRSRKPFIPVNCGAIPENLFENEFFGHGKGAYTDAGIQQLGLVQEAEGGTLFLDEISAISKFIQVKLLRLLQDKEFKQLGNSSPCKADIRIIAATNINLQDLVKEGRFRKDLFYRLNIISLYTMPLRNKKEDIPLLVKHYINKYTKVYNKQIKEIPQDKMRAFIDYTWPGNVRELENIIQQLIITSSTKEIQFENFPIRLNRQNSQESKLDYFNTEKKRVIDSFEISYLSRLLTEQKGNVVSAAKKAGKSRTALWNLLKKHNLSPKQFRD